MPATPKPKRKRKVAPKRVKTKDKSASKTRLPRPAPGTFLNARFSSKHGSLAYKLYTPHGSARRRMPLVVMMHGCTQSATDFAAGTGMNALADELGFIVLYPEQAASANLARCWNWHRPRNQKRGKGEPAAIADLTLHAIATARANPTRIYIAGISAGGAAAAIIAAAYSDLFVAVGVHSGLARGNISTLGSALSAMRNGPNPIPIGKTARPLPTIIFHGDQDDIVHPSNAGGFLNHLRQSEPGSLNCRTIQGRSSGGRDFTRTLYLATTGEILLEDWTVHGSGHAWSGGTRGESYTDPAGPDASREMIRFFLARRRTPVETTRGRRGKACGYF